MRTRPDAWPQATRRHIDPAIAAVAPGQWYEAVRAPKVHTPIAWAMVVVVGAVAATLLTLTTSQAQTPTGGGPVGPTVVARSDATSTSGRIDGVIVEYDFEPDGERSPLAGWSGAGTAALDIDDTVAFRGERSLRIRPDAPRDRRYVEARVAIGDVVAGRSLRDAQITCQLHPGAVRDVAGVRAGLVVEDDTTGADFGAEVSLRDGASDGDGWVELSLAVGARGEPEVGGGTVYQAPQFDPSDIATLAVYVEAPRGGMLTTPIHVDTCVIDLDGETRTTRADRSTPDTTPQPGTDGEVYVPALPPVPEQARSPAPAPDDDDRAGDGGSGVRNEPPDDGGDGDIDGGPDTDDPATPPSGQVLLRDFERPADALEGVASDGAALGIDDTTALHGQRSLRISPEPSGAASLQTSIVDTDLHGIMLDGARVSCHLRGDSQAVAAQAHAGLIVEDARGAVDHGAQTALRGDGRWVELALVIGARGEAASDGGIVPHSDDFDSAAVTTLRVRVDAAEPLTTPIHLDHCTVTVD